VIAALLLLLLAGAAAPQTDELVAKSERGKQLMAEQKFEEAADVYRQLVKAVPGNPGLLLNLGMALHLAGHSRAAIAPLAQALKMDGNVLPAYLFLGASYLAEGDAGRALAPLQKYVRLQPGDPGGQQTLGDALMALDRYADAADHFRKVRELEPANPHAYYGLVRCYTELAKAAFAQVEHAAPESAWWFALVGDERMRRHQLHSAFFFYKKAEEKMPHLPDLHAAIATVYEAAGHADWAASERKQQGILDCAAMPDACDFIAGRYVDVIRRGGESVAARFWQSRAFSQLAEEAFERLERLPDGPEIHELRAERFANERKYTEAVAEWRKALEYVPNDEHLREELLSALYRAKQTDEALRLCDDLLKANPSSPELNFIKGDLLLSSQRPEEAIPYLERAVRVKPDLLAAQHALGRAYMQVGKKSAAIPHLERALAIDSDGSLRYQLAQAYRATGQTESARNMLEQARERQKADQEEKSKLEAEMQITAP
jgi:tetratricopeptide (TPR) repeat protein